LCYPIGRPRIVPLEDPTSSGVRYIVTHPGWKCPSVPNNSLLVHNLQQTPKGAVYELSMVAGQ
jgi:hypothetical protein